jgi:phosphate transport system substrate-binding protein
MSRRVLTALVLPSVLLLVAACAEKHAASPAGALAGKLSLTGSSTIAPLASEIAARFEALHPDVRIDVQTGGSTRGIADAAAGLADIGMTSRALADDERTGLASHLLARDGVCFIVNAANPVTALDDEELRAIYLGRLERWSEVGGPDEPITVINRAEGRSELELVSAYLGIEPADIVADVIAGENQQGIKQVASDPHALCYMSLGTSEHEARTGVPLRLLALRGIEASTRTLAAGTYPLARPLLLVAREEPSPLAAAFLAYARSAAVHDLVRDHAFVPVAE